VPIVHTDRVRELADDVVRMYSSGMSLNQLVKTLALSMSTVRQILSENSINRRPRGGTKGQLGRKRHALREDAFDVITEESAYWVGFLMADGCISDQPNRTTALRLSLQRSDENHVKKFSEFLGYTGKIGIDVHRCDFGRD